MPGWRRDPIPRPGFGRILEMSEEMLPKLQWHATMEMKFNFEYRMVGDPCRSLSILVDPSEVESMWCTDKYFECRRVKHVDGRWRCGGVGRVGGGAGAMLWLHRTQLAIGPGP